MQYRKVKQKKKYVTAVKDQLAAKGVIKFGHEGSEPVMFWQGFIALRTIILFFYLMYGHLFTEICVHFDRLFFNLLVLKTNYIDCDSKIIKHSKAHWDRYFLEEGV